MMELIFFRVGTTQGINTGPFRRAVAYYVKQILGIKHAGYNYKHVSNREIGYN
jgi:hypothetical protein